MDIMRIKAAHLPRPASRQRLAALMLAGVMSFASASQADDGLPMDLPPPLDTAMPASRPTLATIPPVMASSVAGEISVAAPDLRVMRFITLGRVIFASGKWQLSDKAKQTLDKISDYLAANPGATNLLLDGHTDWVGGMRYNDALSVKRAEAVRVYLASKGMNPELLHWKGHGERAPIDENWTRHGRDRNRQVELYAVYLPSGS